MIPKCIPELLRLETRLGDFDAGDSRFVAGYAGMTS
jgi:hypothetical protein